MLSTRSLFVLFCSPDARFALGMFAGVISSRCRRVACFERGVISAARRGNGYARCGLSRIDAIMVLTRCGGLATRSAALRYLERQRILLVVLP